MFEKDDLDCLHKIIFTVGNILFWPFIFSVNEKLFSNQHILAVLVSYLSCSSSVPVYFHCRWFHQTLPNF